MSDTKEQLKDAIGSYTEISRARDAKNQQSEIEIRKLDITEAEQGTRHNLARWFVVSFFLLMFMIMFCVPLYNFIIFNETNSTELSLNLNDLLLTYSSIVGPMLGFVIGYYFKSKD